MLKTLVTGLAFAVAALSFAPSALAQQQPNLLIMGEDADLDTVPRNSRIFNRVLRAIEAELQAEGFAVYDETAVSMGITDPARVRRTDAELITVARRVQDAPIDAIIVFQIYASTEENAYGIIVQPEDEPGLHRLGFICQPSGLSQDGVRDVLRQLRREHAESNGGVVTTEGWDVVFNTMTYEILR
jgi:hypothetical protein